MGDDQIALGLVVGLDYRDASLSVHDLLQQFKTHPLIRPLLEGGERDRLGREDDPRGRLLSLPVAAVACRAPCITGDAAGFVNVPKLKGIHYAMRSGMLAAETIYEQLKAGADPAAAGRARRLRRAACARATSGATCTACATCARRSTAACRRRRAGRRDGRHPRRAPGRHVPRPAATPRRAFDGRARDYPAPDGDAHVRQALERVPLGQPQPRRPAQPHPRAHAASRARSARRGWRCARRASTSSRERRAAAWSRWR